MVQILLLNTNVVIFELLSLGLEDTKSKLIEIVSKQSLPQDFYDIVFIDDSYGTTDDIQLILDQLNVEKKILLSTVSKSDIKGLTQIITKPFLPTDIATIVKESSSVRDLDKRSSVLDLEEIQTIKELLDEEASESIDNTVVYSPKKSKKQKRKKTKEIDSLVEKILSMKTKKIKQILEGADITISIKFPKGE